MNFHGNSKVSVFDFSLPAQGTLGQLLQKEVSKVHLLKLSEEKSPSAQEETTD